MKIKHIWSVLKKEIKDIIRDRKTIITTLVIPMLTIPLISILMGGGVERLNRDIHENIPIALAESSRTREIEDIVKNNIMIHNQYIRLKNVEDPIEALRQGEIRLVLEFEEGYQKKLSENKPFDINILYDQNSTKSYSSVSIMSSAIHKLREQITMARLTNIGIDLDILEPIKIVTENINEGNTSNMILVMILPLMIVILITVGGMPAATDLIAGEKERNTLEPLLTTKASRLSILVGKYITITLFSLVSVLATALGFLIGYLINPNALTMGTSEQLPGVSVEPTALLLGLVIMITLSMTFSAIQVILSTYAKSFKEAQTYLTFLMVGTMVPAYGSALVEPASMGSSYYIPPILNAVSSLKMIISGNINYNYLMLALFTSTIYVVLSLRLAKLLFMKEKYLFKS